jgi:nicotinamidase-related amidase
MARLRSFDDHGSLDVENVFTPEQMDPACSALPGSFTSTELEMWLRERNVETVVIAGYMTQMCCDTTTRQAMHLGFGVEFLSDGTGTLTIKNDAGEVSDEKHGITSQPTCAA